MLEVDELWSFVEMKEKRVLPARAGEWIGGVPTFTAICADTKLIPWFMVGTRDAGTATVFFKTSPTACRAACSSRRTVTRSTSRPSRTAWAAGPTTRSW